MTEGDEMSDSDVDDVDDVDDGKCVSPIVCNFSRIHYH